MTIEEELHALARQRVEELKAKGIAFDKKLLRWNDIVAVAIGYMRLNAASSKSVAVAGLIEAIQCCQIGHDMHVDGRGPLTLLEPFRDYLGVAP